MADPRDLIDLKTAVPSQALYDEIAVFEGFSPVVYGDKSDIGRQPMRGVPTIGYGTIDPHYAREGVHLTKEQAMALLKREVDKTIVQPLRDGIKVATTQGQFDVFCSIAYNIGVAGLLGSTIMRFHNMGDNANPVTKKADLFEIAKHNQKPFCAADAFVLWSYDDHLFVQGLFNRRLAERNRYLAATKGPARPQAAVSPGIDATAVVESVKTSSPLVVAVTATGVVSSAVAAEGSPYLIAALVGVGLFIGAAIFLVHLARHKA